MRLFYASGRLVYNFGFEDFTSFPVPQLRLTRHGLQSRNYGSEKSPAITAYHGIELSSDIPISQSATIPARGSLMSLPSSNLSQSRLTVISPILHPWLLIAGKEATWLLQQGIRIHGFPLMSLIINSSRRPIASFTHCIVCKSIFYSKKLVTSSYLSTRLQKIVVTSLLYFFYFFFSYHLTCQIIFISPSLPAPLSHIVLPLHTLYNWPPSVILTSRSTKQNRPNNA